MAFALRRGLPRHVVKSSFLWATLPLAVIVGTSAPLLITSCKHARVQSAGPRPDGDFNPNVPLLMPPWTLPDYGPREIDMSWLELDDFLPPGASAVLPPTQVSVQTYITPRAYYPSTELCVSGTGMLQLECMSWERRLPVVFGSGSEASVVHALTLRSGPSSAGKSLWRTVHAFDVLWSNNSRFVAVSHFHGDNQSEVLVIDTTDPTQILRADPIPAVRDYFTEHQLASPVFLKAYRWSNGPMLLLRAIGQSRVVPHDSFGYEVLVDVGRPADAETATFVRGFVLHRRPINGLR